MRILAGVTGLLLIPMIVAAQPSALMPEYNRAYRFLGQWQPDQAIGILQEIVAKDPSFYRAYDGLFEAFGQKKNLPALAQYFNSVQERTGIRRDYFLAGQARILFGEHKPIEAEQLLKRCIERLPRWPGCYTAVRTTNGARRDSFVKYLRQRGETDPTNPVVGLGIGAAFFTGSDGVRSAEAFDEAASKARRLGSLDIESLALRGLEDSYAQRRNFQRALEIEEQRMTILKQLGDEPEQIQVLLREASYTPYLRDQERANRAVERFERRATELGGLSLLAQGYLGIATPYREQGDADLAMQYFDRALRLYERSPDVGGTVTTLLWMGDAESHRGRFREALECLDRCARIDPQSSQIPYVLRIKGNIYEQLGEYTKALEFQMQSVDAFQRSGRPHPAGAGVGNIGDIYVHLGDYSRASECFRESLRSANEFFDPSEQESNLARLGQLQLRTGRYQEALRYLRQAYILSEQTHNTRYRAATAISMGVAHTGLGRFALAEKNLKDASQIAESIQAIAVAADARNALGILRLKMNRPDDAEQEFRAALALCEPASIREASRVAYEGLGEAALAKGRIGEAVNQFRAAVNIIESLRLDIQSPNSRTRFLSAKSVAYERLVELLAKDGKDREALGYAERSRARSFLETLAESRAGLTTGLDPEKAEEHAHLLADISKASVAQDRRKLQRAEDAFEQWSLELRKTSPRFEKIHYPIPLDAAGIQSEVASRGLTLVTYALGDRASYVWLVAANQVIMAPIPPRLVIERMVDQYRKSVSSPKADRGEEISRQLYAILIAPVARHVDSGSRLIIVPDGVLHYLPFEALMAGQHYFGERHDITYVPSATAIAPLGVLSNSNGAQLLAFGDPDFHTPNQATPAQKLSRGIDESRGLKFTALPNTRQEVEGIAALYPGDGHKTFLGSNATKSALKGETLTSYRRIHFATHALLDDHNPGRSGIALSPEGVEDGVLRLHEVLALDLNAELVVLSACQTGLGTLVRGEGFVGLTKAFLYAGAARVVVSLWEVNDVATSHLMQAFYQKMSVGMTPAHALREAKLGLLNSGIPAYRHPFYWAPFVLVGAP